MLHALVLLMLLSLSWAQSAQQPPNIVIFLVDDLGWNDSSVDFGLPKADGLNTHYRTPHLERFARDSARFTQAYAQTVCTPTRVSLLTGISPMRHGVTDWTQQQGKELNLRVRGLQLPHWNCNGLQRAADKVPHSVASDALLPLLLKAGGYRTIHVGKGHWAALGTPGADPRHLGFDVNVAGHALGSAGSHLGAQDFHRPDAKRDRNWDVPGLEAWHGRDITLAEALTDAALEHVRSAAAEKKPFLLHFAHYAVHTPIQPAQRFAEHYAELKLSKVEQNYAQMVEDVDTSFGRVLDELEKLGLARNTLIFHLSDNGGFIRRGGASRPLNAPLRDGKGSGYEGGLRTPLVVHWPQVSAAGVLTDAVARIEDLLPTCLDAASLPIPQGLDGRSLRGALSGREQSARDIFWYYPHNQGPDRSPFAALRSGDLKLLHFFEGPRLELYDLKSDPREEHDLAAQRPDTVRELDARLMRALADAGRELPRPAK